MHALMIRTAIMEALYERRVHSANEIGAWIEVTSLARHIGADTAHVAAICKSLIDHAHVDGDNNMLGFVRISDNGMRYCEEIKGMAL